MAYRDSTVKRVIEGSGNPQADYPTLAADDILTLWVVQDGNRVFTDPAGWTRLQNANNSGPDVQSAACWYKVATGSESGTLTITSTTNTRSVSIMCSHSGRNTGSPITFSQPTSDNTNNSTPISVALTGGTAAAGDDLLWFAQLDMAVAADVWGFAAPSGFTEREDDTNGDWITTTLATQDAASAGATGTITGTATRSSGSGGAGFSGVVVALAAAAGGGGGGTINAATIIPQLNRRKVGRFF